MHSIEMETFYSLRISFDLSDPKSSEADGKLTSGEVDFCLEKLVWWCARGVIEGVWMLYMVA